MLIISLRLASTVKEVIVVRGNDELERNLVVVETVALSHGLPPDAVSLLLDLALSFRAGKSIIVFNVGLYQSAKPISKIKKSKLNISSLDSYRLLSNGCYCIKCCLNLNLKNLSAHRKRDLFADFEVFDTFFSCASGSHCTMYLMAVCGENDN